MKFPCFPVLKKHLTRFLGASFLIFSLFPVLPIDQQNIAQAKPLQAPAPGVTVNAPSQMMIGEDFSFTVTFDNTGDPGYGPFIDVVFPTQGADGVQGDPAFPADGIAYLSGGTYAGINLTCETLDFDGSGELTHPYYRDNTGDYVTVSGTPGDTFVSCLLPFGSVVPEQPPVEVTFQASLSELADAGTPLPIRALGGFIFGADPLDNWCCDDALPSTYPGNSSGWTSQADVTPTVLTLSKSYSGPEDETATGPNYQNQFTVTVDVAEGQTVEDFVLQDVLPDNLQFVSLDNVSGNGYTTITDLSTPSTSTPGGTISREFDQIVGTAGGNDASLTFTFYIPRDDADSNWVIDPDSGDDVTSLNNAQGAGTWVPIDTKDGPGTVTAGSTGPPAEYTITDKSIAIQKSVSNPTPPNSPGDILEYTYSIQISDFFAFQDLEISDLISDGQHVLPASDYVPQLTVSGNGGYSLGPVDFSAANYDVSCNYTSTAQGPECTIDDTAADTGDTALLLRISDELVSQGRPDGKLLGGCIPTAGGTADCTAQNDGPTTITITYRTEILQEFVNDFPSGDPSVDQGDVLDNQVTITGSVLENSTLLPTTFIEEDGSQAGLSISRHDPEKFIYAINGLPPGGPPINVQPGDEITFQLAYDLITSDVEELYFTDFLPLPVLSVDDFNADGAGGDSWAWTTGANGKCANLPAGEEIAPGVPQSGIVCFGPTDTFYDYTDPPGIIPTIDVDVPANAIEFTYGDFDDPRDQSTRIDILFTVTVNNQPYADGLFFTNQAQVHEGSTNSGNQFTDTIVDFILREPFLVLDKGVVASDNPNAVFSPDPPAPLTFTAPGSPGQRWSGTINSVALESTPISSTVSDVDGGDLVSFALVIENEGRASNGAFDIKVSDQLPYGFSIPSSGAGLNLSIYRGDGTLIDFIPLDGSGVEDPSGDQTNLFAGGLELEDLNGGSVGACQEYDENDGENIIILTYDLVADDDIAPLSEHENLGKVFNYANTPDGPDFTGEDADLTAETTVTTAAPEINKLLTGSELDDPQNAADEAVIGELVTYQLEVTIPEGESPNTVIVDTLDSGLAFVQQDSFTNSNSSDVSISGSTDPVITDNGQTITWDLGLISNTNRDNNTAETLTFDYTVVTLNTSGNQTGTDLDNSAVLSWDSTDAEGSTVPFSEGPVSAEIITVIEPDLSVTKTISPGSGDSGDILTVTLDLIHSGDSETTAYDVVLSDVLPADMAYTGSGLSCTTSAGLDAPDTCQFTGDTLTVEWLDAANPFPPGETASVEFDVELQLSVTPGEVITNTADLSWTSLPGDFSSTARSGENPLSVERTGDTVGPGGIQNDYSDSDSDDVTITSPTALKTITGTDQVFTSGTNVAVGEMVTYQAVFTVPEGTSSSAEFEDTLDAGLAFDQCLSVAASPALNISIPLDCSEAVITDFPNSDPENQRRRMTIDFGQVTNPDTDNDTAEIITVTYRAVVLNSSSVSRGEDLNNLAVWRWDGNSTSNAAPDVTVVEPELEITKTATPNTGDYSDPITFTIQLEHAAASNVEAYDLVIEDIIPADLLYIGGSLNCTGSPSICIETGGTIVVAWTGPGSPFQLGDTAVITFDASLDQSVTPGEVITNTADLTWTSLPGDETTPGDNPLSVERTGNTGDPGGSLNNYQDSGSDDVTIDSPIIDKTIAATNQTFTLLPNVAVGEIITYTAQLTVPEGTSTSTSIVDTLDPGLAFVGCDSVAASADLSTTAPDGFSCDSAVITDFPNSDPENQGRRLTFDFQEVVNSDTDNLVNETISVQYRVVVLNSASVTRGAPLDNNVVWNWDGDSTSISADDLTVIEPAMTVSKSVSPNGGDSGDEIDITITVENTGPSDSPAFDVVLEDTLPGDMTYDGTSLNCATSPGLSPTDTCEINSGILTVAWNGAGSPFPVGESATITFTVTLDVTVSPGEVITNTADLTWTSLPGDITSPQSTENGISVERTGDPANPGATENDYSASGSDDVTIDSPTAVKSILSTNQAFTSGTDVAVGEQITYQVTFTVPEGTSASAQLEDILDPGLAFVGCNSVVASSTDLQPDSAFTCASASFSEEPSGSADPEDQGRRMTLTLGEITNNNIDNNTDETITVTYTAVVLNSPTISRGVDRNNQATWFWDGSSITASAPNVNILEPDLSVSKTASSSGGDAGDTITFTLEVVHTGAAENTDAFNVVIDDLIPSGMTYVPNSLQHTVGQAPSTVDDSSPPGLQVAWDSFLQSGGNSEISFQVSLDQTVTPGQVINNTADLTWTSLPGDVTGAQSGENTLSVERTGNPGDPGGDENDYRASASDDVTIDDIAVQKTIAPSQYTIGEELTYTIEVILPEGTVNGLQVIDEIPAGLEYLSHSVDTTGFVGTIDSTPTSSSTGGSGGDLTLTFEDPDPTIIDDDNNPGNNGFSIAVTAVVLNEVGNQSGDSLLNTARVQYDDGPDETSAIQITLIEPELEVEKNVSDLPSEVDAGGEVTYQAVLEHTPGSNADAYDIQFLDTLPADLILGTVTVNPAAGSVDNSSGNTVDISVSNIPNDGSSVVIEYTATIASGVTPGQNIPNTGTITWTSLSGTPAEERTGADGAGGLNDYKAEDGADITIDGPVIEKTISSTGEVSTGDGEHRPGVEDLAIGEEITFALTVTLPEGVSDPVQVVDNLPVLPDGTLELLDACVFSYGSQLISIENQPAECPVISGTYQDTNADTLNDQVGYDFGRVENAPDNAVDNGDRIIILVRARVINQSENQDSDQLVNQAEVTIGSNLSSSDLDLDLVEPDLDISKSVDDNTPANGQTVTFTLEINHTPDSTDDAFDLVLIDTIPAGFSYVPGSLSLESGLAPTLLEDGAAPDLSAEWSIFPGGSTSRLTYQAVLDDDVDPDEVLTNTSLLEWTSISGPSAEERTGADGSSGLNDYYAEDSASSTTTNADLTVTKTDGQSEYTPGTSLVYDILVSNVGNEEVIDAEVRDAIPSQIISWEWACTEEIGGADGCDGVPSTSADFSDLIELPAGASIRYTVTAQISSAAGGALVNTVAVSPPSGVVDPTPGNNQDSDTDTQNSQADLSVTKDDGLTVIAPGTTLTYTVVAANAGPSDALGVEIEDVLPAGITTWDWACTGATGGADQCTGVSGSSADFSDTIDLPAGSTLTYTVTAQVSSSASGSLTNTVIITPPTGVTDSDLTNNTASDTDLFAEHSKTLTSTNQTFTTTPEVAIGEILTYQITLSVPPGEMVDLTLTDQLEQGLAYLDCQTISGGSLTTTIPGGFDQVCSSPAVSELPGGSAADEDQGRQVVYDFGTVENGSGDDLDLVITYRTVVLNNLANQSGVNLNNQADWNWTGGSLGDSADQVILREPDLTFRKSVSPRSAFPGQTVTFSITVEHTGISETPAYDATLTDTIPAGLTYVPGTLQHVSGQTPDTLDDSAAPDLTVIWDEFLNNGQESVISFQVTLDGTLRRGDRVENTAALSWTSLPGDVSSPQSAFNILSTERFYDPGSAVNVYGLEASATIRVPALPETGFAPGMVTELPQQPSDLPYAALEDLRLEIPLLDLSLPIVSVPQNTQGWDLTWLWQEAGWLEGTAFPTWQGNTALTGHAYLSSGAPGPFVDLGELSWGDEVQIISHGQVYTYQVREKKYVSGDDLSILGPQERDWLTLFTCQEYSEQLEGYRWRLVVQAVLVDVDPVE